MAMPRQKESAAMADDQAGAPATGEADTTAAAAGAAAAATAAKDDNAALGEAGKAALDAERKARRDAEKRAREFEEKVNEFQQRDMTEQQKLEQRAATAEQQLTPLQQENARLKVALAKGLTGDKAILAERLRGNTEEELAADADELLKHFGGVSQQRGTGFDGGARGSAATTDMDTLIRQSAGLG